MRRRVEAARDVELLWPNGLGTTLAVAAGRALAFRRGVARQVVSTPQWSASRGRHAKREMDAAVVAGWLVGQFPAGRYNGMVLGSPHGAAVHLAMALGVPWLPVAFEIPTPDVAAGERPADDGERTARDILGANPDVTVRQVYDPVWRGWSGTAAAHAVGRWRRPPGAYRECGRDPLPPGPPLVGVP